MEGYSAQWYMNTNFSDFFWHPVETVQGIRYDYTFAILRNPHLMPRAYELGVDRVKCRICCAFDLLFRMTPDYKQYIADVLSSIGVPHKPLVTLQLETSPLHMTETLHTAELLVQCADRATQELNLPSAVLVPVFSDFQVEEEVVHHYTKLLTPVHVAFDQSQDSTGEEVQLQNAFVDLSLMLNSTLLVRTKGYRASFGNIADALRQHYHPPGSVFTYILSSSGCQKHLAGTKIE